MKLAIAAAAAVLLAACGEPAPPAAPPKAAVDPTVIKASAALMERVKVGAPAAVDVREAFRVSGRVEVDEARVARVGSPVTGRITELEATVGQDVRRGQRLATLTSTELSSAQLGYLQAFSQKLLAERAAQRAQQLFEADVIGLAELQRRQSELVQADAEVSAARDQLKVLGMSESGLLKLASSRTVNSTSHVVASLDGTVIERKVTTGQVVQPADAMFVVADLSHVWIVADIPEQNAGMMRIGESVEAEVAALPGRRIKGQLSFVAATVNPDTRTIRVRMDLPNPDRELKPAMLATVLVRGKPQKQTVVPVGAVVREENRDYVFVQTAPDTFQLRQVALGAEQEGNRVVIGGLREGDAIVVDGAFHLNNERNRLALQGS
jgi:cobalt-zinc-cadmium efflux system membrane fusion protein